MLDDSPETGPKSMALRSAACGNYSESAAAGIGVSGRLAGPVLWGFLPHENEVAPGEC